MTMTPVDRLFPLPAPEPTPGCATCARLDEQRAAAEAQGDLSRVSDCNVRLRAHLRAHSNRQAPIPR